jgi:hypothetical protein
MTGVTLSAMLKPFNVTLIRPPGYRHSVALAEAVDYLHAELRRCGYQARTSCNALDVDAYNVMVCGHLLSMEDLARLPPDTIIFNSEQLVEHNGRHFASGVYRILLARHHVWDYSPVNLTHITHDRASVIPFLYCDQLARTSWRHTPGNSFLFYGSLTPYRRRLLQRLRDLGLELTVVVGEYGAARDRRLFECRAVLNLHKTEDRRLFEPIRCFYPLINGIPVISEETTDPGADLFRDSMVFLQHLEELPMVSPLSPLRFRETSPTAAIHAAVSLFLRTCMKAENAPLARPEAPRDSSDELPRL